MSDGREGPPVVQAQRSDARRNVDVLLEAARDVFATEGVDVPARAVAARAGVGVGTLYRHFPQRSDLVLGVVRRDLDECVGLARALLGAGDPMEALGRWVERYAEFVGTKRGLGSALHSGDPALDGLGRRLLSEFEPSFSALLGAARTAGEVRDDVRATDILRAVAHLCTPGPDDPEYTRRMVAVLLDGLRTRRGAEGR